MNLYNKLKIRGQLIIKVLGSFVVIYCITIIYLHSQNKKEHKAAAEQIANITAARHANIIKGELEKVFQTLRTLAELAKTSQMLDWESFDAIYMETQKNLLKNNKGFLGVATSWEYSYLDKNYTKKYGRLLRGWYNLKGAIIKIDQQRNMQGDDVNSQYYAIKTSKKERLVDPEFYSPSGKQEDRVLNANFNTPILINNRYIGLTGVDVDLGYFQNITDTTKPMKDSYSFILSNNGTWVTSHHKNFVGEKISETNPNFCENNNLIERIQKGEAFSVIASNTLGKTTYYSFSPIITSADKRPWSFVVAIPLDVVTEVHDKFFQMALIIGLIGLVITFTIIVLVSKTISDPIIKTTQLIKELAKGNIFYRYSKERNRNDEIGEMEEYLELLTNGLANAVNFARELGAGNLNATITKLSDNDLLAQTLTDAQINLKKSSEELELKHKEEKAYRWISETIAKLEDILRKTSVSIKELGYNVLIELINDVNACQGALFLLNDDDMQDTYYEMVAAIAYDRRKLLNSKIYIGEGLVGRCAHEKMMIYMTNVPENYVHVSSGLGEANPNCILLMPAIESGRVLGIIELVSFKIFDKHQIEFIEKASTIIAANINSIKVNKRTEILLIQAQQQAEVLSQQEEEMKQNIEEMNATIEESQKTQNEMKSFIDAVNNITMVAVYDMARNCIDINDKFIERLGLKREMVLGKKQGFFASREQDSKVFDRLWNKLQMGEISQIKQDVEIKGEKISLVELYAPVFDSGGNVYKVFNIVVDITK